MSDGVGVESSGAESSSSSSSSGLDDNSSSSSVSSFSSNMSPVAQMKQVMRVYTRLVNMMELQVGVKRRV